MGRRCYPAELRRKVLDLLAHGKSVAIVAHNFAISGQTTYLWRSQDLVNQGLQPGLSTADNTELTKTKEKIAELQAQVAMSSRATELPKKGRPTRRYCATEVMAAQGLAVRAGAEFSASRSPVLQAPQTNAVGTLDPPRDADRLVTQARLGAAALKLG